MSVIRFSYLCTIWNLLQLKLQVLSMEKSWETKMPQLQVFLPIENAKMVNSFVSQEKFAEFISLSEASVIIVSEKFVKEENYKPTLIVVEDAYLAFQVLMNLYQQMREEKIRN